MEVINSILIVLGVIVLACILLIAYNILLNLIGATITRIKLERMLFKEIKKQVTVFSDGLEKGLCEVSKEIIEGFYVSKEK